MLLEIEERMPILLLNWLVVSTPWKLWKSDWIIIQKKWGKSHSCSKPPTSIDILCYKYYYRILSYRYIYIYSGWTKYRIPLPTGSQGCPVAQLNPSWIPAPLALAFPQDLAGFGHHRPIIPVPIPPDEDADGPDAAAFGASGKTWLTSRIGLVLITSYKYLVVVSST